MPGLVTSDGTFLFENGNTAIAKAARGFQGCRQSNDSAPDDNEIKPEVHRLDNTMAVCSVKREPVRANPQKTPFPCAPGRAGRRSSYPLEFSRAAWRDSSDCVFSP